jgi:hypothetical protein
MRGCVSAGMATVRILQPICNFKSLKTLFKFQAVWYLGLQSSVDVVYGSSAGSLVGAYFITGQLPYFGPEIYYDVLTTAGIDIITNTVEAQQFPHYNYF